MEKERLAAQQDGDFPNDSSCADLAQNYISSDSGMC